jgi:hypothetical protein
MDSADVESLGTNFEVITTHLGECTTHDLKKNGRNIPVTASNREGTICYSYAPRYIPLVLSCDFFIFSSPRSRV